MFVVEKLGAVHLLHCNRHNQYELYRPRADARYVLLIRSCGEANFAGVGPSSDAIAFIRAPAPPDQQNRSS